MRLEVSSAFSDDLMSFSGRQITPMPLREEFEKTGNWLFRWRSYLPFFLLPFILIALHKAEYLERAFGDEAQTIWDVLCIIISFSGLLVRTLTIGWVPENTSGRNTKAQVAASLNTKGIYSIVRHPLYFGNFLITLGMFLFIQVWWLVLLFISAFWLYYEKIMFAEEEFLRRKFGDHYIEWGSRTPAFLPAFSLWQKPDLRFSWRMVLKREYSTFLGIIVAFVALKFFGNLLAEGRFGFRITWAVFLIIGLLVFGVLHYLRRRTKWLHIPPNS